MQSAAGTAVTGPGGEIESWSKTLSNPTNGWNSGTAEAVLNYNLGGLVITIEHDIEIEEMQ